MSKNRFLRSSRAIFSSCPRALFNDMEYASLKGNCVRLSWYDSPNGNLNLNRILGIAALTGFEPRVCTWMQYFEIDKIRTLVLFVSASRLLKFLKIMQTSPTQRVNIFGGTLFLWNLFKTSGVNISFKIFWGYLLQPIGSSDFLEVDVLFGFSFWVMMFHLLTSEEVTLI